MLPPVLPDHAVQSFARSVGVDASEVRAVIESFWTTPGLLAHVGIDPESMIDVLKEGENETRRLRDLLDEANDTIEGLTEDLNDLRREQRRLVTALRQIRGGV